MRITVYYISSLRTDSFLTIDNTFPIGQPIEYRNRSRVYVNIANLLHSFLHSQDSDNDVIIAHLGRLLGNGRRTPDSTNSIVTIQVNYREINAGDAEAAIAKFSILRNARAATRRYTSVKVNRRVLLFAGLLCLRKLRIRATIIVTSVTYSPGLMAVTMAATPAQAGVRHPIALGWGTPREVKSKGVCKRVRVRGGG